MEESTSTLFEKRMPVVKEVQALASDCKDCPHHPLGTCRYVMTPRQQKFPCFFKVNIPFRSAKEFAELTKHHKAASAESNRKHKLKKEGLHEEDDSICTIETEPKPAAIVDVEIVDAKSVDSAPKPFKVGRNIRRNDALLEAEVEPEPLPELMPEPAVKEVKPKRKYVKKADKPEVIKKSPGRPRKVPVAVPQVREKSKPKDGEVRVKRKYTKKDKGESSAQ